MSTQRMDHVALATRSIRDAVRLFVDVLGAEFLRGGDDDTLRVRTMQFKFPPGIKVELMEPLGEDSYLQRFIEKHGQGFHHVTFLADNIEEVVPELDSRGFETVDTDLSHDGWRETFVRPSKGFGALIQVADSDKDWMTPDPRFTIEDVLDGQVVWHRSSPEWRNDVPEPRSHG